MVSNSIYLSTTIKPTGFFHLITLTKVLSLENYNKYLSRVYMIPYFSNIWLSGWCLSSVCWLEFLILRHFEVGIVHRVCGATVYGLLYVLAASGVEDDSRHLENESHDNNDTLESDTENTEH